MHFPNVPLLSFLLFSLGTVRARPLSRDTGKASLTLSTKVNTAGVGNVIERDQARVQSLIYASLSATSNGPVNLSNSVVFYTAQVGVGTPPAYRTFVSCSCS